MTSPVPEVSGPALTEAILNWLWLTDLPAWDRALEITGGPVDLGIPLRAHFGRVDDLDLTAAAAGAFPHEDAAFDCVVAHGILDGLSDVQYVWSRPRLERFLREGRRVLRPGGCFALGFSNPFRIGRRTRDVPPPAPLVFRLGPRLRASGFSDVRRYQVEPRVVRVDALTPAAPALVRGRLDSRAGSPARRAARRVLAWVGSGDLLFPATLFLARA